MHVQQPPLLGVVVVLVSVMISARVLLVCDARTSPELKVTLPHGGELVGRHWSSHKGRSLLAFLSIPYAQPPIGKLRFMPPVPFGPWKGEKLATTDAPVCVQRDPYVRELNISGTEDCLYLNVYTPQRSQQNSLLPTMVWFHGGGWQAGSGNAASYGPDYLMDHDIVLVSANYRVGPLGFLSTETLDCPGNFGLKDQLLVLQWVQANIASFGGDPKSVTIFGESSGAASVTYLMLVKQARGLFHKGIAESGTYLDYWAQPAYTGVPAKRAAEVAKLVGCVDNAEAAAHSWSNTLNCLRSKPAEDIAATIYDLYVWDIDPEIPFPPVLEPPHDGAFLTTRPRDTQGDSHGLSLSLMVGINTDEGLLRTVSILNMPGLLDEYKERFYELLPVTLYYDHHSRAAQNRITEKIENFYFKNGLNFNKRNYQNFTDLMTDGGYLTGLDEYVRVRVSHQNLVQKAAAPTFVYLFQHKGAASFTEIFGGGPEEYYGVCHADELQYLFPVGDSLFVSALPSKRDVEVREAMLSMWVNFAKSSDPTPLAATIWSSLTKWRPATKYPIDFLRVGDKYRDSRASAGRPLARNDRALYQDRANFWEEIRWAHLSATNRTDNETREKGPIGTILEKLHTNIHHHN